MSERRFASLTLLPGAAWLVLLFLVPLAITLAISFGVTDELGNAIYGWNPENYSRVFDPLFAPVLLRSVAYAFGTVTLCLLIGYPVAYYIARFGGRYKYLLVALVVLPFLVNYLIRVYAWVAILSDEGLVNGFLVDIGLTTDGVRFLNTPYAVIGGLVYGYMAFMILPVYAALDRMDSSLIEAGKDLYGMAGRRSATSPGRPRSRACSPAPCSSSCPPSATSSAPSCSAGPTPTWSGT